MKNFTDNLFEIIFKITLRLFIIYFLLYLTKFLTELNNEQIVHSGIIVLISEIILYEIWNSEKTKKSYLTGLILSWLFIFSYFNFLNLSFINYEFVFVCQVIETILSFINYKKNKIPSYKLLISQND